MVLGLQMGLVFLGIECTNSWSVIWTLTIVGMLVSPIVFVRRMQKKLEEGYELTSGNLITFNIIEYTLIQTSLPVFFSDPRMLCYGTDGQNGLEFAFTGWMALPLLILLSLVFDYLREKKMGEMNEELSNEVQQE
jgi:hypothetical protein